MALLSIDIVLVASYADGRRVTRKAFTEPLAAAVDASVVEVVADRPNWHSAKVVFAREGLEAYASATEPSEAHAVGVANAFERTAAWIASRGVALRAMRREGLSVMLLVTARIDQDQFDLVIPPALARACGEAELPISIMTNE